MTSFVSSRKRGHHSINEIFFCCAGARSNGEVFERCRTRSLPLIVPSLSLLSRREVRTGKRRVSLLARHRPCSASRARQGRPAHPAWTGAAPSLSPPRPPWPCLSSRPSLAAWQGRRRLLRRRAGGFLLHLRKLDTARRPGLGASGAGPRGRRPEGQYCGNRDRCLLKHLALPHSPGPAPLRPVGCRPRRGRMTHLRPCVIFLKWRQAPPLTRADTRPDHGPTVTSCTWSEARYRSAAEIAEAEGVTRSFVIRLLRLTLPALHIVEANLEGMPPKAVWCGGVDRDKSK